MYAAGVLQVLMENGFVADKIYGTSAGALLGQNYVAGDPKRLEKLIWTLVTNKSFISVKNYIKMGSIFDFDYLLHTLPNEGLPFDQKTFDESKMEFYATAVCVDDGTLKYFPKTMEGFDKALAASASLPPYCKSVEIDGKKYLDGGTLAAVPFYKALEDGDEKIVVVTTRAKGFRNEPYSKLKKRLYKSLYRKYPEYTHKIIHTPEIFNKQQDEMDKLAEEGRMFVIYASKPPKVGATEQNEEKLKELYNDSIADAKAILPQLEEYLSK